MNRWGPWEPATASLSFAHSFDDEFESIHPMMIDGANFVSRSQRGGLVHIVFMRLRVDVRQFEPMGGLFT